MLNAILGLFSSRGIREPGPPPTIDTLLGLDREAAERVRQEKIAAARAKQANSILDPNFKYVSSAGQAETKPKRRRGRK